MTLWSYQRWRVINLSSLRISSNVSWEWTNSEHNLSTGLILSILSTSIHTSIRRKTYLPSSNSKTGQSSAASRKIHSILTSLSDQATALSLAWLMSRCTECAPSRECQSILTIFITSYSEMQKFVWDLNRKRFSAISALLIPPLIMRETSGPNFWRPARWLITNFRSKRTNFTN